MVEKIIVNPTEVRGYGNIVNVKSDEDYEPVDCTITEDTDTVYGATVNVIVMEPDLGEATTLTVTSSSSTLVLDGTVTISATLKDSSNAAISGATITFKEGTTTLGNSTTNSSGVATYTYTGASVGDHTINAGFAGDSTYASSTGNVSVTVTDHVYSISFNQSSYVATGGSVEISCTLLRDSSPFSGATVSVTGSDSSLYTGLTDSSGVASITVSNISSQTTFTATYSNVSDTCTVTVQTAVYYANDFSDSSTISDFTDCKGTITKSITGGELVLTAPNNDDFRVYCNQAKLPKGDWKVTINSTTYNYLLLNIGYDPTDVNATIFDITWNYGWGLIKLDSNMNQTTVKSSSSIYLGSTGVWVFEYVNKVMKIYRNGTLKSTYDLNSYDTIGGYVVVGDCCNRTNNISELIIEEL